MRRFRIFVRNSHPEFFDSWEVDAPSIRAAFDAVRYRLGDQPYDELTITEIR